MEELNNTLVNGRQNSSNKIVTIMAYLLGANEMVLKTHYDLEVIAMLEGHVAAQIIRALSLVRMALLSNYKNVDFELRYNMNNIDKQSYFASEIISLLINKNVPILKSNCNADEYIGHVTELMGKYIDECKDLFPNCVEFPYIRKLFIPKGYKESNVRKKEFKKYHAKRLLYPIGLYLYWEPMEYGNILLNDEKFLTILYQQNKDKFEQAYLFKDVSAITKEAINDFIAESERITFAVDCENVDPYKFFGMISSLPNMIRDRIKEITLYDDVNANTAWTYFKKCFNIPVKHIQTERVLEHKSVVDMELILGVMKQCYESLIDSVVLCSSDSDFLPLIQALPNVNFMVLYEEEKCSNVTKSKWKNSNIPFYTLDNYYQAECDELQKYVFVDVLKKMLPLYIGRQVEELLHAMSYETRFVLTDKQLKEYYNSYIKNIRLCVDERGMLTVAIG